MEPSQSEQKMQIISQLEVRNVKRNSRVTRE